MGSNNEENVVRVSLPSNVPLDTELTKSEADKLKEQYERLMKDAFNLSKTDRTASDAKYAEAQEVLTQIEKLDQ